MKPTITVTDNMADFKKTIDSFRNAIVLVGIPQEDSARSPGGSGESSEINNATLLAINEFGSPVNNIPSRHPVRTGIKLVQDEVAEEFKKAATSSISGGSAEVTKYYERAGMIASNSIKNVINNNTDMDPPAASTLVARKAAGFSGKKALIVTGQMRNAITYVVTGKG